MQRCFFIGFQRCIGQIFHRRILHVAGAVEELNGRICAANRVLVAHRTQSALISLPSLGRALLGQRIKKRRWGLTPGGANLFQQFSRRRLLRLSKRRQEQCYAGKTKHIDIIPSALAFTYLASPDEFAQPGTAGQHRSLQALRIRRDKPWSMWRTNHGFLVADRRC